VHNVDRAQLLVESSSRPALQAFLKAWMAGLRGMKTRVRWSLEVDPLDI
jgi:primosomal protein N' (replication factor Y)